MLFAEKPGKFSAFAFFSLLKTSFRNIEYNGLKGAAVPKSVHIFKSTDGTDNGTKKVPSYSTAALLHRGTAQLWFNTQQMPMII